MIYSVLSKISLCHLVDKLKINTYSYYPISDKTAKWEVNIEETI